MEMMRSMGGFKDSISQMRNTRFVGEAGMVKVQLDGLGKVVKIDLPDSTSKLAPEALSKLITDASHKAYAQIPLSSDNLDYFLTHLPNTNGEDLVGGPPAR